MIFILFSAFVLVCAAIPALLATKNLPLYRRAPALMEDPDALRPAVSVLIPARNEESNLRKLLEDLCKTRDIEMEVIVLDDHSTDRTAEVVEEFSQLDARIHLAVSNPLPDGWNGKQYACWQLANLATKNVFCFIDADLRVDADFVRRVVSELGVSDAKLVSGFPKQEMGSWAERLLIPMMHFVLLGYLPLERMRSGTKPEFGAGCGQLFVCERDAYFQSGGHESIRASRHDGLKLPRSFRSAGIRTDLFDASDIARVRMYDGAVEMLVGLLKNATEGIANSKLIALFTILLLAGCVAPVFSAAHALFYGWPGVDRSRFIATILLILATAISYLAPSRIAKRLNYSFASVLLHPLAVLTFLAVQWAAFLREQLGLEPVAWKGRK